MFNIKDYLTKFKNLDSSNTDLRLALANLIKKSFNLELSLNQILIKNHIAYLQASSAVKNSVYIKKQRILDELRSRGYNLLDIR